MSFIARFYRQKPLPTLITGLLCLSFCLIDYNRRLIGIRETGSNDGKQVREIQSHCKIEANKFEWCAATVLSGHKACNYDYPKSLPCLASSWFDSTHTVYKKGDAKSLIQEGQVAGYWVRSKNRVGHVGFILSVSDNYVLVVEGNALDKRNNFVPGEGVHLLRRSFDEITFTSDWRKKDAARYHTVRPQETLYRLSVMYKASVEEIRRLNNLQSNIISIGQVLRIK